MKTRTRARYTEQQKRKLVHLAMASGNIERWARQIRINPSMLFRWRRDLPRAKPPATKPVAPALGHQDRQRTVKTHVAPGSPTLKLDQAAKLRLLQRLLQGAVARGFDPVAELGL